MNPDFSSQTATPSLSDAALSVRNLRKSFPIKGGTIFQRDIAEVKAVDDISFDLAKGETLGLVRNLVVENPHWGAACCA